MSWSLVESNHVLRIFSPAHTPSLLKLRSVSCEDSNLNLRLRRLVSYPLDERNVFYLPLQRYDEAFICRNLCKSCKNPYLWSMKIEEAIVYCLATSNRGMRSEQIADMINRQRLHLRKDGQPVTSRQVYAVICRFPDVFVKAEGRIMLLI